jgi:16S rRNA (cytidine1402-2'-O)-methyltransferase
MDQLSGELVVVATPIGNLGDLSERARDVLEHADVLCCEDTRRTRVLLSAKGIAARGRLVSIHAHSEAEKAAWVVARVSAGATVAYVSDAGTPGVSDPGQRLVSAVAASGNRVTTVPGPSAALAALVVAGLPMDRFCVEGFLPRKGSDRAQRLEALRIEERTTVVFETAPRAAATLADLAAALGDRPAALCRELTKRHEEVRRGTLCELARDGLSGDGARGEIVLVIGGTSLPRAGDDDVAHAVALALSGGATTRDAASEVASSLGVSRRRAYEAALRHGTGESE